MAAAQLARAPFPIHDHEVPEWADPWRKAHTDRIQETIRRATYTSLAVGDRIALLTDAIGNDRYEWELYAARARAFREGGNIESALLDSLAVSLLNPSADEALTASTALDSDSDFAKYHALITGPARDRLRIAHTKEKDRTERHLIAARRLEAGELLFSEAGMVSYPHDVFPTDAGCCDYCLAPGVQVECTCGHAKYCSDACRLYGWLHYHEAICGNVDIREAVQDANTMRLTRLLAALILDEKYNRTAGIRAHCKYMQSWTLRHVFQLRGAPNPQEVENAWKEQFEALRGLLIGAHPTSQVSFDDFARMFTATECSQTGAVMQTPSGTEMHIHTLSPLVSALQHACAPNAAHNYYPARGDFLGAKALRTIEPGEVITIDYTGRATSMGVQERRKYILTKHGFICRCPACR